MTCRQVASSATCLRRPAGHSAAGPLIVGKRPGPQRGICAARHSVLSSYSLSFAVATRGMLPIFFCRDFWRAPPLCAECFCGDGETARVYVVPSQRSCPDVPEEPRSISPMPPDVAIRTGWTAAIRRSIQQRAARSKSLRTLTETHYRFPTAVLSWRHGDMFKFF